MELDKRKVDAAAYQSDEKVEGAKQLGNTHFRAKEWGPAVAAYEDVVKRAPKNATIRNNIEAELCNVMDLNEAKREIEVTFELDPKCVKAWSRKTDIKILMKENHEAMDSKNGLEIDPNNQACRDGSDKHRHKSQRYLLIVFHAYHMFSLNIE